MKILLLGFAKIKYMPYANFYLNNIDQEVNEVHIVYWNRDIQTEDVDHLKSYHLHEFRCYQEDDVSKISKIHSFLKYRKFAKALITREQFDFIIVLHSLPGVLLYDILKKKYRDRFIFDYRDSTYERFAPFKKIIGNLVRYSCATFVSSDAFRRYLPESEKEKIYTSHNLLLDSLAHREDREKFGTVSDKIRIAFWGFIRHEAINREIIKKVACDNRFELHYYGREQQVALNLKQYAQEIHAKNVFFHGEYKPEDRYEFIKHTDLIHNIYFDNNMMLAMGNKYYDSVIFRIPQICMKGSYMASLAEASGVGVGVNCNENAFLDDVYRFYKNLTYVDFARACNFECERVMQEYKFAQNKIYQIISKK